MVDNVKTEEFVDVSLIQSVQEGNAESFEALYKQYYYFVWKIGYDYFHDRAKAEDVTQEVFIIVYKNIHKLTSPTLFVAWLNRISYNCCHKMYAKEKKDSLGYVNYSDDKAFVENIKQEEVNYVEQIEEENIKNMILDILQGMKEENRKIGYYRFYEELSYKEICERMDLPLGTVSTKLKRIKEKLQKELKKKGVSGYGHMSAFLAPTLVEHGANTLGKAFKSAFKSTKASFHLSNYLIPTLALSTAVVAPVTTLSYQESQRNSPSMMTAAIQDIVYDDTLTNQPIAVDIKITNHDFDKVLLDGKEDFLIHENGIHTIELYKNNQILDTKQIEIKHIDREKPEISEQEQEDTLLLHMHDNSGIDYQHIQVFINGNESNAYQLNMSENVLALTKELQQQVSVVIPDIAGNKLKIDVQFYEIDKKE